jgi:fructose-1,6-bisphosphatase I
MASNRTAPSRHDRVTLRAHINALSEPGTSQSSLISSAGMAVLALAKAAEHISRLVAAGPLSGALGANVGAANADGDIQKTLDVVANEHVLAALADAPVAYYASEEEDSILTLNAGAPLAVAVDPLDGSSNIDVNVSIGTIFSIYPAADSATGSFFRRCEDQIGAGYIVYGPHTALVMSLGRGVQEFVLDPESQEFLLANADLRIPQTSREYAINASNYRHWHEPVRAFIDDCIEGATGPRGVDFNMRWVASLVAEAHRIFTRGGVFLYPADRRPGYELGRLRLVYEAAAIAMLAEQAGGGATDGIGRILDKTPHELHQRTPLVFGSAEKIERITNYHTNPDFMRNNWPLFAARGLFRS